MQFNMKALCAMAILATLPSTTLGAFVCAAQDESGGQLTGQRAVTGGFIQCTYSNARSCQYFEGNGTFSSGASACPDGMLQEGSTSLSVSRTTVGGTTTTRAGTTTTTSTGAATTTTRTSAPPPPPSSRPPPPPPPPAPTATSATTPIALPTLTNPLPTIIVPSSTTDLPLPTDTTIPAGASNLAAGNAVAFALALLSLVWAA